MFACRGAENECSCGEARYIRLHSVEPRTIAIVSLVVLGLPPASLGVPGLPWASLTLLDLPWSSLGLPGLPWLPLGLLGLHRASLGKYICLHAVEPRTIAIAVRPHTFVCVRWSRVHLFACGGAERDCNCGGAKCICLHAVEPRTIAI